MAHHQGMTIVAIANVLQDGRMRDRFHREPIIRASELLLQERTPRDVAVAHPRAEEVAAPPTEAGAEVLAVRRHSVPTPGPPVTHLMSNGRYSVMLTAAGGGYSRWGDIAVTRWREDATRDDWGAFVYLRDVQGSAIWSASQNPLARPADHAEVQFSEDRARFVRRDGTLTTTLDVLVSGEDDGEVRQVSLINRGRRTREIEVTSFAELALTTPPPTRRTRPSPSCSSRPSIWPTALRSSRRAGRARPTSRRSGRRISPPSRARRSARSSSRRIARASSAVAGPPPTPRQSPRTDRCRIRSGPCSTRCSSCASGYASRPGQSRVSPSGPSSPRRAPNCST
jgi:hypothetical protein